MKFYSKKNNKGENSTLKIIKFGGYETATKNLIVYEYKNDIIIMDCGAGIPDSEMHGIDVIVPDFTYLLENREKIRGLLITHAHEDHFGAVPYLLNELNVPIYSTKLVQEFVKLRIEDRSNVNVETVSFNLVDENTKNLKLGVFDISTFRVNHSVPSALGFAIKTPEGLIMHIADFKVDWAPVLDKPIDLGAIAKYGDEGILCLLSDCLGATSDGYTKSEKSLDGLFPGFFENATGRQIFVTTISSNISRMYQIIEAAIKSGRKVVPAGRSINNSVEIGRRLGYLPFNKDAFVSERQAQKYPQEDLVYLIAGCYGQQGSGLDRVSRMEHRNIRLQENSLVIFSADPNPPGVQLDVVRMMDNLTINGAEVISHEIQDNLHVSGHGAKGDLTIVAAVARPKYFIPIGGEPTKMRGYRTMVEEIGFDGKNVFEIGEGETVEFSNGSGRVSKKKLNLKKVFVDGTSNVGEVVMRDRENLSSDGVFVVVVPWSKEANQAVSKAEVITRGFVYVKESQQLLSKVKKQINGILENNKGTNDWGKIQKDIEKAVERSLMKSTGRRPVVIVHSIKV